jgi:hypothetical protein
MKHYWNQCLSSNATSTFSRCVSVHLIVLYEFSGPKSDTRSTSSFVVSSKSVILFRAPCESEADDKAACANACLASVGVPRLR